MWLVEGRVLDLESVFHLSFQHHERNLRKFATNNHNRSRGWQKSTLKLPILEIDVDDSFWKHLQNKAKYPGEENVRGLFPQTKLNNISSLHCYIGIILITFCRPLARQMSSEEYTDYNDFKDHHILVAFISCLKADILKFPFILTQSKSSSWPV